MPNCLNNLREAVHAEKLDVRAHRARYEMLCKRMDAYQAGSGPSPTLEEFEQWRADVEQAVQLRALHSAGEPDAELLKKPIVQGVSSQLDVGRKI